MKLSTNDTLALKIKGAIIHPDDPLYDKARKVYNAMIDKRPAIIAICANTGKPSIRTLKRGGYVNFMMDEGDERVRASYGDNYERLSMIKAKYDQNNLFRVNQNINANVRQNQPA